MGIFNQDRGCKPWTWHSDTLALWTQAWHPPGMWKREIIAKSHEKQEKQTCYDEKMCSFASQGYWGLTGVCSGQPLSEGHCAIGQGKAELSVNVWHMRPGGFPLPREHSGIHKGDFPGHEVFRKKWTLWGRQTLVNSTAGLNMRLLWERKLMAGPAK